jgi:antirestriction protein ArdC
MTNFEELGADSSSDDLGVATHGKPSQHALLGPLPTSEHSSRHEPEDFHNAPPQDARQARSIGRSALAQADPSAQHASSGRTDDVGKGEAPRKRQDVRDIITNRIIKALEVGTVPWQKPWGASGGWPRSMSTGKRYEGINVLLLGLTAEERSFSSPWWGTFDQIAALGGHVIEGQNQKQGKGATTITFVRTGERDGDETDPDTGEPKRVQYSVRRAFRVFNAAQCEGLPDRFYPQPGSREILAGPQTVLDKYLSHGGPRLDHIPGDRAYYRTDGSDRIVLPLRVQFKSPAHYYATAFHEATHSTGAPTRLNRPGIVQFDHFGSGRYAKEELVAQMGAAMLLAETGLDDPDLFDNSAAYVQSWLKALENDNSLVISAASQAYKALELITEPTRQE